MSSPFSDLQLCSASLFSFPAWLVNTEWDHHHDRRTFHLQPQGRGADLPCLPWWHRVSHRNVWNVRLCFRCREVGLWLLQQEVELGYNIKGMCVLNVHAYQVFLMCRCASFSTFFSFLIHPVRSICFIWFCRNKSNQMLWPTCFFMCDSVPSSSSAGI